MPVTITVTDPSSMDRNELIHVLDFLAKYAGFTGAAAPAPQPTPEAQRQAQEAQHQAQEAQHRTDLPPTKPMPAPQPVPQPPAAPVAGIDVDSAGLPWDGRIHASTRAKVADGTWRMKRGVEPEEVARVEAELRQTMAIPVQQNIIATPAPSIAALVRAQQELIAEPLAVPPAPVAPPPPSVGSAVPPAPPVSSTPVESAGAAQTASPSSTNQFPRLMQMITQAYTQGKLDQPKIQAAVAKAGLPSLPMLASRPDLVPVVATELGFAL